MCPVAASSKADIYTFSRDTGKIQEVQWVGDVSEIGRLAGVAEFARAAGACGIAAGPAAAPAAPAGEATSPPPAFAVPQDGTPHRGPIAVRPLRLASLQIAVIVAK